MFKKIDVKITASVVVPCNFTEISDDVRIAYLEKNKENPTTILKINSVEVIKDDCKLAPTN